MLSNRFMRFVMVGLANTATDFVLFNLLSSLTHTTSKQTGKLLVFSLISSSVVTFVSYFANKHFVFQKGDESHDHKQMLTFFAVNLSGILIVQTLLFGLVLRHDQGLSKFLHDLLTVAGRDMEFYRKNIAKVVTTIFIMIWNYSLYKKVVFKAKKVAQRSTDLL
jgi:putative flippase GtrA